MSRYQYIACHPVEGNQLGRFRMSSATWSEGINGNGSFSGSVTLPDRDVAITQLVAATRPDESALYVYDQQLGRYIWGGPITKTKENTSTGQLEIKAVEWRSWLFSVFLGPKVDLTSDVSYGWTQIDQLQIARDIVAYAIVGGAGDGRPTITLGQEMSGVLRDLNITGLQFKYAGELLDSMAQRDGGFEWTILIDPDPYNRLPVLRLGLFYPERGGLVDGMIFRKTPASGNFRIKDDPELDASDRRSRVWTTGNTETLPFAQDSDPELADGIALLRETVTNYSTVTERGTLAAHARGEREFRSPLVNTLSLECSMEGPRSPADVGSYQAGSRVRLVYQTKTYDLDLPAARITERTLDPFSNGGRVQVTLDLADYELPEVDEA